jgi:hypothetical protein
MALEWSAGLPLSGTLSSGSKFTIVNSLMSSSIATSAANLSTSATEMAFNGNDGGLFKNEFLISLVHSMVELQFLN